ncbi:MAG: POTRA domain-containing protein [Alphaproteobacteria bacterium]
MKVRGFRLVVFLLFFQSVAFADIEQTKITQVLDTLEAEPLKFETVPRPKESEESGLTEAQKASSVRFTLKSIILTGNTLYSDAEFLPFYKKYINKDISFSDLNEVTQKITKKYRKNGYVLSYAMVPKQEVERGIIVIKVVEGYVAQYVLDDPQKVCDEKIKYYLNQILRSKPLHQDVLEHNLLLIRHLFGVEVQTTFTPSTKALNATDLIVKLSRQKTTITVAANNDQVNSLGPWMGIAQSRINNVTNHHDYLEAGGASSPNTTDFHALFAKYEVPVGYGGETVKIQGNQARSNPSGTLAPNDIVSREMDGKVVFRKPVILERDQMLSFQGGMGAQNVKSMSATGISRYTDKTRSLLFGMRYELSDAFLGSNQLDAEFSYGLNAIGASDQGPLRSRLNGTANYTRLTFSFDRLQQLNFLMDNLALLFSMQGQYAGATLLSAQRFGVGGSENRAYAPGALTGDSGLQGRLELQYRIPFDSFFRDIMFLAFYSNSHIWNRAPSTDESSTDSAKGLGGGVRVSLGARGSMYLIYGRPMRHMLVGSPVKDKFYFGINYTI